MKVLKLLVKLLSALLLVQFSMAATESPVIVERVKEDAQPKTLDGTDLLQLKLLDERKNLLSIWALKPAGLH